jgi:hypothetical protein
MFRFIDDIFLTLKKLSETESLKNAFGSLKLNCISENTVNFLDLAISKDEISDFIKFNDYFKPIL